VGNSTWKGLARKIAWAPRKRRQSGWEQVEKTGCGGYGPHRGHRCVGECLQPHTINGHFTKRHNAFLKHLKWLKVYRGEKHLKLNKTHILSPWDFSLSFTDLKIIKQKRHQVRFSYKSQSVRFVLPACKQDVPGGDHSEETGFKQIVSSNAELELHEGMSSIPYMKRANSVNRCFTLHENNCLKPASRCECHLTHLPKEKLQVNDRAKGQNSFTMCTV
jgi:hypothetical protein